MAFRYSTSLRGRTRQRNQRPLEPCGHPKCEESETQNTVGPEDLHRQFVEEVPEQEKDIDASTKAEPITLENLEHTKDSKLGELDVIRFTIT